MVSTPTELVSLDERGIAYITGTRLKVRHIAIASAASGNSPEGVRHAYPHLSTDQIHAALGYYHEHKPAIDAEIAASEAYAEEMRRQSPNPLTRTQLEARLSRTTDDVHP